MNERPIMPPETRQPPHREAPPSSRPAALARADAARSSDAPRSSRRSTWLPARGMVLAAYYGSRLLLGMLVALPVSASVAHVVGPYPRGDAVLWDAGGVLLLETSRLLDPALVGLGWSTALVALAALFALLVPLGALIASMTEGDRVLAVPFRRLVATAAERFGTLSLLMGVVLLLQVLGLALVRLLGETVIEAFDVTPMRADLGKLATWTAGAAVVWLFGVVHDLARVGVVQRGLGTIDALELAVRVLARGGRGVVVAASWRSLGAASALVAAGWAAVALGCQNVARLWAVLLVHLVSLGAVVLLRASWFRWITERLAGEAVWSARELTPGPQAASG